MSEYDVTCDECGSYTLSITGSKEDEHPQKCVFCGEEVEVELSSLDFSE